MITVVDERAPGPSARTGSRFGPYRLGRLLGSGGFGEVYEAEDTTMGRIVALKVLNSSYSHDPAFRQRLFREARTAGGIHDPHVVPIHRCGEIDGQLYIDMRLIDGTNLQGVLKETGPLEPGRAVDIMRQIASALDAAHAAGIIHRDVKPANILLGADDFACLVDFGLANAATDTKLTADGTLMGSFGYLAPERLAEGRITPAADVYALACVLYECLTGSTPFAGREGIPALMAAHLSAPIPRPSQHRPGIPSGFDDVIARGMAKDPAQRYQSAGALVADAQHALVTPVHQWSPQQPSAGPVTAPWIQRPPVAPPTHSTVRTPGRPLRRALIPGALVAALAAGAAIVVVTTHHGGGPAPTPQQPTNADAPTASLLPALNATPLPVPGGPELELGAVAVDKDANVYVVAGKNGLSNGRVLKLAAGTSTASELPFGELAQPQCVAVDNAGSVYVADEKRVLKLAAGATGPTELPFGADASAAFPGCLAVDASGTVYLAADPLLALHAGAASPVKVPLYGRQVAVDDAGAIYFSDGSSIAKRLPGATAPTQLPFGQIGMAVGIGVDGHGNVYVIDNSDIKGRLLKLPAGAGTSTQLYAPENQPFAGLAVDKDGNIYLTEQKRLLKVGTQ